MGTHQTKLSDLWPMLDIINRKNALALLHAHEQIIEQPPLGHKPRRARRKIGIADKRAKRREHEQKQVKRQTRRVSLRPLASLAVKLLGLYAILGALPYIGTVFNSFVFGLGGKSIVTSLQLALFSALPGACQMIVGIGLWALSDGIAHSLVKEENETPIPPQTEWGASLVFGGRRVVAR